MSTTTGIEWTETTWNPAVGCTHVSPGCDNCYAARLASGRLRHLPAYSGLAEGGRFNGTVRLLPDRITDPHTWRKARRVFVNSMSDLFHPSIPDEFIARVWAVMAQTPQHTYQILTKRHGRMKALIGDDFGGGQNLTEHLTDEREAQALYDALWPLPNVWLGVSTENQRWADIRIPALLETSAAVRFISAEPLLGPIDLTRTWMHCPAHDSDDGLRFCTSPCEHRRGIDWVITGGESGPGARPAGPDWFRSIRDQCTANGVAYFHKQNGPKRLARDLDGRTWDEYPAAT